MGEVRVLGAGNVSSINGKTGPVQIGGANLLAGTGNLGNIMTYYITPPGSVKIEEIEHNGVKCVQFTIEKANPSGTNLLSCSFSNAKKLLWDTDYTLSFDMYSNVETKIGFQFRLANGTNAMSSRNDVLVHVGWNKIVLHTKTWNYNPDTEVGKQAIYLGGQSNEEGTVYAFGNMKLDEGNIATGWMLAPEDHMSLESRLAALEAAAGITHEPPVVDGPEIMDTYEEEGREEVNDVKKIL